MLFLLDGLRTEIKVAPLLPKPPAARKQALGASSLHREEIRDTCSHKSTMAGNEGCNKCASVDSVDTHLRLPRSDILDLRLSESAALG
jgi:hypothetical protein